MANEETRPMLVHKVTVLIVDHDGLGAAGVRDELENTSYANHCMTPDVKNIKTQLIDYHDGHPLNSSLQERNDVEYNRLFPDECTVQPESAAIILNADGSYELALPKTGDDDVVKPHVLLTTALFHLFSTLSEEDRERIVDTFLARPGSTGDD